MIAVVAGTTLTTPDTTRSYTVTIGPHDVTGDTQWDSLVFEDQGSSAQGTLELRVNGALSSYSGIRDQQVVEVNDHMAGGLAFRGLVDSRRPAKADKAHNQIDILASAHDSILDNVIPFETRPAGESDRARIGYLWGKYATGFLAADLTYVQQVSASLPAQIFAGVSLRQALDMIAAQASSSAFWYLDAAGRPHYGTSESNDAPKNVTSDTPGAGEIAPLDLDIDFDSKGYIGAVYVRGKTDAGSGWVYSESSKAAHNGLIKTAFFDAPDCTTSTMRDNLGRMYLGRVGAALSRGSFSSTSKSTDGWRAGQNVNVRSSHLGNINAAYRIARVRTSVLGPSGTRPAGMRKYEVEFGSATGGRGGSTGPVVGTGIVGDILDDGGNLLLGSGSSAATSGFGPAIRRYITSGVYNGDFALAPPFPDSTIVEAWNPLPFWTFTQASGVAVTCQSIEDSGSASGRVIRFSIAGGAAGDEGYLEQIIPVNGSRNRAYSYAPRFSIGNASDASTFEAKQTLEFLKADGVTVTGSSDEHRPDFSEIGALYEGQGLQELVPADAYFARVRIGLWRNTEADTATGSYDLFEARLVTGTSDVLIVENNVTGPGNAYSALFQAVDGDLYLSGLGNSVADPPALVLRQGHGFGFNAWELGLGGQSELTPHVNDGRTSWNDTARHLTIGDSVRAKPVTPVGFAQRGLPPEFVTTDSFSTTVNMAAVAAGLGGAMWSVIQVTAPMLLRRYSLWNTDSANLRTAEARLYVSRLHNSSTIDFVTGTDATWSFTPGAAAAQQSGDVSGAPVLLAPGWYYLVIRNTSATQTFGIGTASTGGKLGRPNRGTNTVAALSSTLDVQTGWTTTSLTAATILVGYHPDGSTLF